MKKLKLLILSFLCLFANKSVYSSSEVTSWTGTWDSSYQVGLSTNYNLPFYTEYFDDYIIINNRKPDKDIYYEIVNEYGEIIFNSCVKKENSYQILIKTSELPYSKTYTIILTSSNPLDKVSAVFAY